MRISHLEIGARTLTIAEVGSNHCGDPELARRSVREAADAGADVVKFQMYDPERLVDPTTPVLSYIAPTHRSQRERFQKLRLPREVFLDLADLARQRGILFLVTPFDEEAVDFLDPLVPAFKIASGDLTNTRLLKRVVEKEKPVIVSTGFATVEEIDWLVQQIPKHQLCLMHCVGAYPTPPEEVNLEAIPFLADRYKVPVGFSDHTCGIIAALAAVAKGACLIEKHFVLSKDIPAADVALSATPEEFRDMVKNIRQIEQMNGVHGKSVQISEQYFRSQLRRSVYAARDLSAGETLSEKGILPLRPFIPNGIGAENIAGITGRTVRKPIEKDHPLFPDSLQG